jgi:light-regulated signal transduction histidine kinase (bacteriophytochrome)
VSDEAFPRVVSLACHDLRTPLATVTGFAKTLLRTEQLDERSASYVRMIDAAADQLADLLEQLGVLARIEGGRYDPPLVEADTLVLATSGAERVETTGAGETIATDHDGVHRALEALAIAAVRHGGLDRVTWTVRGRELALAPVTAAAGAVLTGEELRDLGSIVAAKVIAALGGSLRLEGETLRVTL